MSGGALPERDIELPFSKFRMRRDEQSVEDRFAELGVRIHGNVSARERQLVIGGLVDSV